MATYTFTSANAAMTTQTLTGSFGVNVHEYPDTPYKDVNLIKTSLDYLGFSSVRTGINTYSSTGLSPALAAAGYKIDAVITASAGVVNLASNIAALEQIQTKYAGAIKAIEGANELDYSSPCWTYNGTSGIQTGINLQKDMYAAIHSSAVLAGVQVLNLTMGNNYAYSQLGDLSAFADQANVHSYAPYGWSPASDYAAILGAGATVTPGKQTVISEAGYSTAPLAASGVDETVQAKYSLDLLLDGAKYGVGSTYLYELFDEHPDTTGANIQQHYGLFNNDGTPKLAATAIHNMTTILNNGASSAGPTGTPLSYTLTGLTNTDSQVLLEKSAGVYDLALWSEPNLWNSQTHSEIAAAGHTVTVTFGSPEAQISVYDPLVGTSPLAQYTNASSITLSLSDHPYIVEVSNGASSTATSAKPAISSYSTGTLALAGGVSNSASITLAGRGSAGSILTIMDGLTNLGSTTVQASGVWSYQTAALADGSHIFDAVNAQNLTSDPITVKIDATAPIAPTIAIFRPDGLTPATASTNSAVLSLQGSAEALSTVVLYDGTRKLGTTTATSLGKWNFTTGKLTDGQHNFTATATDQAQNTSVVSQTSMVSVDTVAPKAPLINVMSTDGSRALNPVTNQSAVMLTGSSEAGACVQVFDGTSLVGMTSVQANGTWSLAATSLSEGKHSFSAVATDAAKNVSASSRSVALTTDYTAPVVSITAESQDSHNTRVWGTTEAGSTITIVDQSSSAALGRVTADKTGYWIAGIDNRSGNLALNITATDSAGNIGAANLSVLTAGTATSTLAAQNNSVMASGFGATNFAINKDFVNETIYGFYGSGAAADSLQFDKSNFADLSSLMTHATQVGADTIIATDAAHTLTLKGVTKSALASASIQFGNGPKAPSISMMPVNGSQPLGALTNQSRVMLTGTSQAGTSVQVFDGATLVGTSATKADGTWSVVTSALSEGIHALSAVATDAANNASSPSKVIALTTDYTAPPVSIAAEYQDSQSTRVWGSAEAGSAISLVDQSSSAILAKVTADKNGNWIAGVANRSGNLALNITATDAAGNVGVANLSALTAGTAAGTLVAQNNSVMASGNGATNFAINKNFVNETVYGFYARNDSLQFDKSTFADMSSLMSHASQVGGDTVIAADPAHTLTLKGVSPAALTTANVHFA